MKYKKLFILLTPFFLMSYQYDIQNSWEIDKDKDGIKVYTRTEEYSDFKSFKAVAEVNAPPDKIIKILKDADNYSKWYGYTKTSKILKQEQDVQFNYVETTLPWPYQNRDMVYRMSIENIDSITTKIFLKGIPDYISEMKGIKRMKKAEGYILLKASGNNTEIVYLFHSEPGNNIPSWLANNSIAELPFKTLSGLRAMLER